MAGGGGKDRASGEHTFSSHCCRRSTIRPSQLIALSINEAWQVGTMRAAGPPLSRFYVKNNQVHERCGMSLFMLKCVCVCVLAVPDIGKSVKEKVCVCV